MSKRIFVLIAYMICVNFVFAQNLYFVNPTKHKIIEIKVGQQLSIKHNGYLGQNEFVKQTITDITDSSITLGIDPEIFGPLKKIVENNPKYVYRKILIKDITAFRRITTSRQLLKSALILGNIAGTYILLSNLYKNNSYTITQTFLISAGVGVGTTILINALLPENPKYKMADGWEVLHTLPKQSF